MKKVKLTLTMEQLLAETNITKGASLMILILACGSVKTTHPIIRKFCLFIF